MQPGSRPNVELKRSTSIRYDRIIYDKASGTLDYDKNGVDSGIQVKFAQLDEGQKLKYSDLEVFA